MAEILTVHPEGLYCPAGQFYIDAKRGVPINLITHGHADHARWGCDRYWSSASSFEILKHRLGQNIHLETLPYGQKHKINQAWISFHPAGHLLGSAQIRVEVGSDVWVVSGDYKRTPDPSCEPFEVVPCDVFISENTFGLPIYHWPSPDQIARQIMEWWKNNAERGIASVVFCYALGKAQRLLNMLAPYAEKPIFIHGAIVPFIPIYEQHHIQLAPTLPVSSVEKSFKFSQELILAPPSANQTPWIKRFFPYRTGCASGWMAIRGAKRWASYDRGFTLSDHADWEGLLQTFQETQAKKVLLTHGFTDPLVQYLNTELQLPAAPLGMTLGDEQEDEA